MTQQAYPQDPSAARDRYRLTPYRHGYRIERLVADTDFTPPLYVHGGYLGDGRFFRTRDQARDFMRARLELAGPSDQETM